MEKLFEEVLETEDSATVFTRKVSPQTQRQLCTVRYAACPNTLRPPQAHPRAGEREENGPTDPVGQHWVGVGPRLCGFYKNENGAKRPLRVTDGGRTRALDLERSHLIHFEQKRSA